MCDLAREVYLGHPVHQLSMNSLRLCQNIKLLMSTELTGDGNNRGWGWKWFDITIIGGLEQSGGMFGEIENSRFLS